MLLRLAQNLNSGSYLPAAVISTCLVFKDCLVYFIIQIFQGKKKVRVVLGLVWYILMFRCLTTLRWWWSKFPILMAWELRIFLPSWSRNEVLRITYQINGKRGHHQESGLPICVCSFHELCIGNSLEPEKFQEYISMCMEQRQKKLLKKKALTISISDMFASIYKNSRDISSKSQYAPP